MKRHALSITMLFMAVCTAQAVPPLPSGAQKVEQQIGASHLRGQEFRLPSGEVVRIGEWTRTDSDGGVKWSATYVGGKLHGVEKQFAGEQLIIQTTWRSGERDGLHQRWTPNGIPVEAVTYKDGSLHGPWKRYSDLGTVSAEGAYSEGRQTGEWMFYNSAGVLERTTRFVDGLKQGPEVTQTDAGSRVTWYWRGLRHGPSEERRADGSPASTQAFRFGLAWGTATTFAGDGEVMTSGSVVAGVKDAWLASNLANKLPPRRRAQVAAAAPEEVRSPFGGVVRRVASAGELWTVSSGQPLVEIEGTSVAASRRDLLSAIDAARDFEPFPTTLDFQEMQDKLRAIPKQLRLNVLTIDRAPDTDDALRMALLWQEAVETGELTDAMREQIRSIRWLQPGFEESEDAAMADLIADDWSTVAKAVEPIQYGKTQRRRFADRDSHFFQRLLVLIEGELLEAPAGAQYWARVERLGDYRPPEATLITEARGEGDASDAECVAMIRDDWAELARRFPESRVPDSVPDAERKWTGKFLRLEIRPKREPEAAWPNDYRMRDRIEIQRKLRAEFWRQAGLEIFSQRPDALRNLARYRRNIELNLLEHRTRELYFTYPWGGHASGPLPTFVSTPPSPPAPPYNPSLPQYLRYRESIKFYEEEYAKWQQKGEEKRVDNARNSAAYEYSIEEFKRWLDEMVLEAEYGRRKLELERGLADLEQLEQAGRVEPTRAVRVDRVLVKPGDTVTADQALAIVRPAAERIVVVDFASDDALLPWCHVQRPVRLRLFGQRLPPISESLLDVVRATPADVAKLVAVASVLEVDGVIEAVSFPTPNRAAVFIRITAGPPFRIPLDSPAAGANALDDPLINFLVSRGEAERLDGHVYLKLAANPVQPGPWEVEVLPADDSGMDSLVGLLDRAVLEASVPAASTQPTGDQ